jgi:hypothetical protein
MIIWMEVKIRKILEENIMYFFFFIGWERGSKNLGVMRKKMEERKEERKERRKGKG